MDQGHQHLSLGIGVNNDPAGGAHEIMRWIIRFNHWTKFGAHGEKRTSFSLKNGGTSAIISSIENQSSWLLGNHKVK